MSKKIILFLVGIIFFSGWQLARADVIINEVAWMGTATSQYEEWVELRNTGSESVSLVGWKLYKNSGTVLFSLSKTIPAGGYFVVCRTTPSVSNPLLGSCDEQGTFGGGGLINTSDLVQLKNASGVEVDLVDGTGGWPAGKAETRETMQWDGSSWITATPTPGEQNEGASNDGDDDNTSSDSDSSEIVISQTSTKIVKIYPIRTKITAKTMGIAGVPMIFEGSATDKYGKPEKYGKYYWNFGDGDSKEVKEREQKKFFHTFYYPGDYTVTLEYSEMYDSEIPDATDKIVVKIVPASVSISRVGDAQDFFIELSNGSQFDQDISNWMLISGTQGFTMPKNTIIKAKNKMMLSPKITGFTIANKYKLQLLTSEREVVSSFYPKVARAKTLPVVVSAIESNLSNQEISVNLENSLDGFNDLVLPEDLSASVAESDISNNNSYLWISGLIVLLAVSAGAIWFIRRRSSRAFSKAGDEFEMLDE